MSAIGMGEVRVVDPVTGGEKGSKVQRFDLIPPEFEWALAEHYGKGAEKYADRNWERGYKWGLSFASLRRHLNQWEKGEDLDEETGSNHLIAAAWHIVALYIFQTRGLGEDDLRPKPAPPRIILSEKAKAVLGEDFAEAVRKESWWSGVSGGPKL